MKRTYPKPRAIECCRNALQLGYLTKGRKQRWIFGRRKFHPQIVNALIDAGEAVRIGDHVVAWRPL